MKEVNINIEGYNVNGICVGCLNYNRRMFYHPRVRECFRLLGNIDVPDGLEVQVCWECLARVKSAINFREQMLTSYDILISYSKEHTFLDSPNDFDSYASTNLERTEVECFDCMPEVDEVKADEIEVDVKEEEEIDEQEVEDKYGFEVAIKEETIDDPYFQDVPAADNDVTSDEDVQLSKLKEIETEKGKKKRKTEKKRERDRMASGNRTTYTINNRPGLFDADSEDSNDKNQDPYSDADSEYGSDGYYESENDVTLSSDSDYEIFNRPRQLSRQVTASESESSFAESDKESYEEKDNQAKCSTNTKHIKRLVELEVDLSENYEVSQNVAFRETADHQLFVDHSKATDLFLKREEGEASNLPNDDIKPENVPSDAENESASAIQGNSRANEMQELNTNRSYKPSSPVSEEWQDIATDIPEFNFDSTTTGPRVHVNKNMTAEEIFDLMFPSNMIEYLVTCTNAYGKSLTNQNRPHTFSSRIKVFNETNADEMKKFLGLTLLQGQIKIPDRKKFFTHTDVLYYHPIFSHVMSNRRYEQILRCICCSELNCQGSDKVNTFIKMLTQNFRNVYQPKKELSLHESLMLYKGRLVFRTYMKNKKTKYDIKLYILATDDGYILNILMYSGNQGFNDSDDASPKIEKLVMRLMRPYLLKGHELFMHNFYNSVGLSEKLLDLRTHTSGTLHVNRRGNPSVLAKAKLKKGEHKWFRKNKVYVSQWKDKRQVLMITTLDHPEMIEVTNKRGQKLMKPKELVRYKAHMSGIDRAGQMVSYYSCPRKTVRWYKKVLFHLMDLTTWNAYYFFSNFVQNNNKTGYIEYRDKLIKSLLKVDENKIGKDLVVDPKTNWYRKTGQPHSQPGPSSATRSGHWPIRIEGKDPSKKKFLFKNCRVCQLKKIRRQTSYRCKGCHNSPPLCTTCFEEWHLSQDVDASY